MKKTILIYRLKKSFFGKTCKETIGISSQKLLDVFEIEESTLDDKGEEGIMYDFIWKEAMYSGESSIRKMRLFKVRGKSKMIRLEYKKEASDDFRKMKDKNELKEIDSVYIERVKNNNEGSQYYFDYIKPSDIFVLEKENDQPGWTRWNDRFPSNEFNELLDVEHTVINSESNKKEIIKITREGEKYYIYKKNKEIWKTIDIPLIEIQKTKTGLILRNRNKSEVKFEYYCTEVE